MRILACMVVEKSLTKYFILESMDEKKMDKYKKNKQEKAGFQSHDTIYFIPQSLKGKKIGQLQRRISRRRLVLNPTIQQCFINLATKYDYSRLHGS